MQFQNGRWLQFAPPVIFLFYAGVRNARDGLKASVRQTAFWYSCGIMRRVNPTNNDGTSEDFLALYRRAFAEHGARALWNIKQFDNPTNEQALAIVRQLRTEGDMSARRLAERIEKAARANL